MKNTYEAVAVLSILVQPNRSFGGMIYSESKEIDRDSVLNDFNCFY